MPIEFRHALPTDVNAAVPLMYSSGPAAFEFVFSTSQLQAQSFARYAFLDGAGEFGYQNHTVAVLDGKVVGIGAAFTGASSLSFTLAAARQILSFYGLQGLEIIQRGLQTDRLSRLFPSCPSALFACSQKLRDQTRTPLRVFY